MTWNGDELDRVGTATELELAAHYVPAVQGVGGDFFLTAEGPRGSTVLLVGDVVGKGVEAARRYLVRQAATDPRVAGAKVDDFFDLHFIERARASGVLERLYGQASPTTP